MKAAIYTRYGPPDVLEIREVEKPVPGDDQVLIKVRAAGLNPLDWRIMRGEPLVLRMMTGLRKPSEPTPGRDVAGRVEAVGKNVSRLKLGDEVFGACPRSCAEYACGVEPKLTLKPPSVSFEQAASVAIAAVTALQGLRDHGRVQPGQKVLINGAAGGVGTYAVQIAKWLGADVTGVCSTKNVEMVRSLGANHVFDYTREDFTRSGQRYDVILDNVGNHSLSAYRSVLNPKGICAIAGGPKNVGKILVNAGKAVVLSWFVSQKLGFFAAKITSEDLRIIGELMQSGKVTAVVDRQYPLIEIAEAMRYLETGHARGKVVIKIAD